ncbi:MAG TPA: hypothetical protein VF611_15460 [Pyrinomonadaceae bacterium]
MKYLSLALLLLLLCLSPATRVDAAAAQGRVVLAEGEPPLTSAMVDDVAGFFGWLFESRFTAAQRRELERVLVATWRGDDRKEIEAVARFGEFNAKLAAAAEGKRAEARGAMLPEVLKGVRAESTDFSRLLLSVYEAGVAARAGGDAPETSEPAGASAAGGGGLVGSWRSSELGMIGYQNSVTGATRPGRGTTMQYRFLPGGRYEYNGYLETTMYNCTTTLFNPAAGTYRVEGDRLTLAPRTSKWQQRNNCAASMNKELPGKLDPETYTFRFTNEAGVRRLCLTSPKGGEVCYRAE